MDASNRLAYCTLIVCLVGPAGHSSGDHVAGHATPFVAYESALGFLPSLSTVSESKPELTWVELGPEAMSLVPDGLKIETHARQDDVVHESRFWLDLDQVDPQWTAQAVQQGWHLRARIRLPDEPLANNDSPIFQGGNASRGDRPGEAKAMQMTLFLDPDDNPRGNYYRLNFHADETGNPVVGVAMSKEAVEKGNIAEATLPAVKGQAFVVDEIYDPADGSVDVLVDGNEVLTDITPDTSWVGAPNQLLVGDCCVANGNGSIIIDAFRLFSPPTDAPFYVLGFVRQPGDANEDKQFDFLDIIQSLDTPTYEKGLPATWQEGDWNGAPDLLTRNGPPPGDGVFDSKDIIAALAADLYESGPYAANAHRVLDVPEPPRLFLAVLLLFVLSLSRSTSGLLRAGSSGCRHPSLERNSARLVRTEGSCRHRVLIP